jgi:hypothetical protein
MPCIADVPLNSLLHQQGFRGILNQTAIWLANAALGTLIDQTQGWEPARRDDLAHSITADGDLLRQKTTRTGGHLILPIEYLVLDLVRGGKGIRGILENQPVSVRPGILDQLVGVRQSPIFTRCRSLLLFVWPGKNPDGSPFACGQYRPDDVQTFGELLARGAEYGVQKTLTDQLTWLRQCARGYTLPPELYLGLILAVRRPIHLIGSESNIELICYMAKFADLAANNWHDRPVEPAAHNEQLGVSLCRTLSGAKEFTGSWTLIGAGSLGSKVAMHLTREGMAPRYVVDRGEMRAHNAVRHALSPQPAFLQAMFAGHKASMLCDVIAGFSQESEPLHKDAVGMLRKPSERRRIITKNTTALVNSAASIRVREALAAIPYTEMSVPVIETSLYSAGRLGLITVESGDRNPNTADLITEFYRISGGSSQLRDLLFDREAQVSRVGIGDGCASPTMIVSDAKVSAHAAAMAQIVSRELESSSRPDSGDISIGTCGEDEVSLAWSHHRIPPVKVFLARNLHNWTIRLSAAVETAILEDVKRWPDVETGGILMGRISEISRTFYVVDILPAPPDSKRSAGCFTLGVQGVNAALKSYSVRHGWSLYCLGTWHSHLGAASPSSIDKHTANCVALARVAPSLLLIKAPAEYSALVADAARISTPA